MIQCKIVEEASEHSTSLAGVLVGAGTRDTESNIEAHRVRIVHSVKILGI